MVVIRLKARLLVWVSCSSWVQLREAGVTKYEVAVPGYPRMAMIYGAWVEVWL